MALVFRSNDGLGYQPVNAGIPGIGQARDPVLVNNPVRKDTRKIQDQSGRAFSFILSGTGMDWFCI